MFKISMIQKLIIILISITFISSCKKEIKDERSKQINKNEVSFSFINTNKYTPINSELLPDSVFQIPIMILDDDNLGKSINYYEFFSELSFYERNTMVFTIYRHENSNKDLIIEYLSFNNKIFSLPVLIIVRRSLNKGCIVIWDRTNVRVNKDSLVRVWEINKYTPQIYSNLNTYFLNRVFPEREIKASFININRIILNYNNSIFLGCKQIGDPGFTLNDTNNFFSKIKIENSQYISQDYEIIPY